MALARAGRLVGAFLERSEGAAAAERFAAGFRLQEAARCGGTIELVYLPLPGPDASAFATGPQRFRVDPHRGAVTWAFGPP